MIVTDYLSRGKTHWTLTWELEQCRAAVHVEKKNTINKSYYYSSYCLFAVLFMLIFSVWFAEPIALSWRVEHNGICFAVLHVWKHLKHWTGTTTLFRQSDKVKGDVPQTLLWKQTRLTKEFSVKMNCLQRAWCGLSWVTIIIFGKKQGGFIVLLSLRHNHMCEGTNAHANGGKSKQPSGVSVYLAVEPVSLT